MMLAWQSNLPIVSAALFLVLVLISKSKYLFIALALSGVVLFLLASGFDQPLLIGVGILVIFLLILKKEEDSPQQGYNPGGM